MVICNFSCLVIRPLWKVFIFHKGYNEYQEKTIGETVCTLIRNKGKDIMEVLITHKKNTKMLKAIMLSVCALVLSLAVLPLTAFGASSPATIPVEQIFNVQPGAASQGVFSYVLTPRNAGQPMPTGTVGGSYTFTITGSSTQTITIGGFSHAADFFYTLRAADRPANDSYLLDDTVYTLIIRVTNTADGGLSAMLYAVFNSSNINEATKVERIVFDKSYAFTYSGPVADVPVVKTVQGNPAQAYTFTFRLTAQTTDAPMPQGSTGNTKDITITGSGRAYFGTWTYSTPGIFVYQVREIPSNNSDYEFDTSIYTITDTVTDEGGQLVVNRVVTNADNRPVQSMSFINIFVGRDTEIQETTPTPGGGGTGTPTPGPKTGDYADPAAMMLAMAISAAIALFTLFLIYIDRRSEEEHEGVAV